MLIVPIISLASAFSPNSPFTYAKQNPITKTIITSNELIIPNIPPILLTVSFFAILTSFYIFFIIGRVFFANPFSNSLYT